MSHRWTDENGHEVSRLSTRHLISPAGVAVEWTGVSDETVRTLKSRGWREPPFSQWKKLKRSQDDDPNPPRAA